MSRFVFFNVSIIMNLACSLKLWPFFQKCLSANIALGSFTSFLWLFNLMLNGVSFSSTYCRLHIMHSIRKMTYSVSQWNIFQVLVVCWLLNIAVVFTFSQHIFPVFALHGVHLPSFKDFKSLLTLLFSIQYVSIISEMFLFRLNAVIGSFSKIYLRFSFICKVFQFFVIVLVIFGRNRLHVITRSVLSDFFRVSFSIMKVTFIFHNLNRFTKHIFKVCSAKVCSWYAMSSQNSMTCTTMIPPTTNLETMEKRWKFKKR